MNHPSAEKNPPLTPPSPARPNLVPAFIGFALGLGLAGGAVWHYLHAKPGTGTETTATEGLSPATLAVLAKLPAPVTLNYYDILTGNTDADLQAFAERVNNLLGEFKESSGGKIQVQTSKQAGEAAAQAADHDGLHAFHLNQGEPNYLGVVVTGPATRETLPQLDPGWEPALEFDLARAIERVASATSASPPPTAAVPPTVHGYVATEADAEAGVRQLVPDLANVTLEQASGVLLTDYTRKITSIGTETEAAIEAAQQKMQAALEKNPNADITSLQQAIIQLQQDQVNQMRAAADLLAAEQAACRKLKGAQ